MNTLEFCEIHLINYTVNSDDTIDVDGNVNLSGVLYMKTKLPVKFGKVYGYFSCRRNNLTTLENCPKYIGGNFYGDVITHHILGNVHGDIYYTNRKRIVI
jgi:hypothetical protein